MGKTRGSKAEAAEKDEKKTDGSPVDEKASEEEESKFGGPAPRDVCIGDESHRGTAMLLDLIRLHYSLIKKEKKEVPTDEKGVEDLATRLTLLMMNGKQNELSGLKDVPRAFLKGTGKILVKKDGEWMKLSEEDAKSFVAKTILEQFKIISEETPSSDLQGTIDTLFSNFDPSSKEADEPAQHSAPRPCDVLFLPIDYPWEESMPYEHQSGNKHLLFLASQHVAADTNDSTKRVKAAFKLVTSEVDVNSGTDLVRKTPRYVIQTLVDNQNTWKEMELEDLAEFAAIFVFEVYLEKQIHGTIAPKVANILDEHAKPSTDPVDSPTSHDVLFGRGGMTNGHPGNRRFRDIIALHRPDYIRATKMDKPNVARRIVRAIRLGDPSGRFLKKAEDGKWYDVGDRTAAEKTSQGLRERSNAEKRQRSALREALRIRREDLEDGGDGKSANKKAKLSDPSGMGQLGLSGIVPAYVGVGATLNYASIPLSLSMKEKAKDAKSKKGKKGKSNDGDDANTESLPPNAVDKDGNILVTDYDILCGRGGLTNHHQGNKRFRDIVALHRPDYVRAPKIQKPSVARVIVRAIRNGDPPGRFLKKDDKTGKWYDIGDKRAAEKTSQALREKTNEEKASSSTPFGSPTLAAKSKGDKKDAGANGDKEKDADAMEVDGDKEGKEDKAESKATGVETVEV